MCDYKGAHKSVRAVWCKRDYVTSLKRVWVINVMDSIEDHEPLLRPFKRKGFVSQCLMQDSLEVDRNFCRAQEIPLCWPSILATATPASGVVDLQRICHPSNAGYASGVAWVPLPVMLWVSLVASSVVPAGQGCIVEDGQYNHCVRYNGDWNVLV